MRNVNVLTFVSMDGVMQGPGAPEEDTSGGFRHGGWTVGYFDNFMGQEMNKGDGAPIRPLTRTPDVRHLRLPLAEGYRARARTWASTKPSNLSPRTGLFRPTGTAPRLVWRET